MLMIVMIIDMQWSIADKSIILIRKKNYPSSSNVCRWSTDS